VAGERVLVVEDDEAIGEELHATLTVSGYDVTWARDAASALAAASGSIDLVLLDLGLPDVDGIVVARQLRRQLPDVLVVVLTARSDELDVISALDAGADDYLTKPFRLAELLARLRAHLRRHAGADGSTVVAAGGLRLDLRARTATVGSMTLPLRPKELELLAALVTDAGRPVRREQLMAQVWDEHWFGSTKTLDVHIAALRRKLARAGPAAGQIATLRGYGYRYDAGPLAD
jgi:DNA-binding response OmpR family regulator